MMLETHQGPITTDEAKRRWENGGYAPMALYLDAKSIYAAVTATNIRPPSEKS